MVLLGLSASLVLADSNPDDNYDDELGGGTPTAVELSTTYYDDCWWDNEFAGSGGWSDDTWVLTWGGGFLMINCHDWYWHGDFYSVWIVDPGTGTTVECVLTTPEVETDWHHGSDSFPCPVSDPMHTGEGSIYSDGTVYIFLPAGIYDFRVRNELFQKLQAEENLGYDVDFWPEYFGWSPSGFTIGFHRPPPSFVVPEVPMGTVAVTALMMAALLAYGYSKNVAIFHLRRGK